MEWRAVGDIVGKGVSGDRDGLPLGLAVGLSVPLDGASEGDCVGFVVCGTRLGLSLGLEEEGSIGSP